MEHDHYSWSKKPLKTDKDGRVYVEKEMHATLENLIKTLDYQMKELVALRKELQIYFKGVSSGTKAET